MENIMKNFIEKVKAVWAKAVEKLRNFVHRSKD